MITGVNLNNLREDTKKDLDNKLQEYNKCALIRPTGWGKTWLLTSLIKDYKNVLYIYPLEVIADTVKGRIKDDDILDPETYEILEKFNSCNNVTLMTYTKLTNTFKNSVSSLDEFVKYDLVIFDEAHRMMAKGSKKAINYLFSVCSNSKFVGATATPVRTDSQDFVTEFFDGICVYSYTLHDAFQDGLLQKPYYCYCTTDMSKVENDLKEQALTAGEDFYNQYVKEVLKVQVVQAYNLLDMNYVVKDVCEHCLPNTDYMKFICFFSNINHLKAKGSEVKGWFSKNYPNHKIKTLKITSRKEDRDNIKKLDNLVPKNGVIDLVMCVDMLNMGYHVNNLSGIIMYRGTVSDIVYTQQLGRALSSGSENACVVIDIVDNIHRKAVWNITNTSPIDTTSTNSEGNYGVSHGGSYRGGSGRKIDLDEYRGKSNKVKISVGGRKEVHNGKTMVLLPDEYYNKRTNSIDIAWWRNPSRVYPTDLQMTGHEASYREIIAKAVGESLSKRCMEAFELHFRRFCRDNNLEFPAKWSEIKDKTGYNRDDIVKDLIKVIHDGEYPYPLGDEEKILTATSIPLDAFAKWKNVSVRNILDVMKIS